MGKNYYLYLFKDDRSNYKIGISNNPKLRLDKIKYHNPTTNILLINGYVGSLSKNIAREDEKNLHKKFKNKKLFGEWFKLSHKDIVKIWKFMGYHWKPKNGKFVNYEEAIKIFDMQNT